ncbi:MAG: 3-isopropylmalate dehydratase small subunit [Francisellaceae bacterium]
MKAFKRLTSKAIPLWLNDIDTDMIIPAQYLTQTTQSGYGDSLFIRLRKAKPDFVFNRPEFKDAKILLAGSNFGCGSSREHAVWSLQQSGIEVVIASSFSDIFFNNATKNGLLLIQLDSTIIESLCQKAEDGQLNLTVDLESMTLTEKGAQMYTFAYDPFRRACLLEGQDDLDYLLAHRRKIDRFEARRV